MDGGGSALHADGGELDDFVGDRKQLGNRREWLAGEGGVEAGEDDPFAEMHELQRERDKRRVKELRLVDSDDLDLIDLRKKSRLQRFNISDGDGVDGLRAVRRDGGTVVARVEVGLEAEDATLGDLRALEAADELLGFSGKHGAGNDFNAAGVYLRHVASVRPDPEEFRCSMDWIKRDLYRSIARAAVENFEGLGQASGG